MNKQSVPEQKVIFNDTSSIPVYVEGGKFRDYEYQFPMHIHDEIEILVALKGPIYVSSDKMKYVLNKNDVVLVNRRVPHSTVYPPYACTNILQFRLNNMVPQLPQKTNIYLSYFMSDIRTDMLYFDSTHPISKVISSNIELILKEKENKDKGYEMYIQAYLKLILATLYRNEIFKDDTDCFHYESLTKVLPVIRYIEENYTKDLTLDSLCGIVNMNKSHLCRVFKKAIGITMIDYLNFIRIWNAEKLLATTDEKILNVSMNVGFSNISYFNRTFKQTTGMTPSEYKNIVYSKKHK